MRCQRSWPPTHCLQGFWASISYPNGFFWSGKISMRAAYLMKLACQRLTDNKEKSGFSYSQDDERERVGRFAFSDISVTLRDSETWRGGKESWILCLKKKTKAGKHFWLRPPLSCSRWRVGKVNLYVARLHQPNRLKHFRECLTAVLHLEIRAPPKTQLIITMTSLHHFLFPFSFTRSLWMFGDALIDFSHHIKTDFPQKQPRTALGFQ